MSDDDGAPTDAPTELRAAKELLIAEEVIAAIRHDVRNKLAAIRQAAYYLRTKTQATDVWAKDPRMARFFDLIDEQVDAADGLFGTNPFLDKLYVRDARPVRAREIIEAAIRVSGGGARMGDVQDAEVRVDANDVTLALVELVANAREATPEGHDPPTIEGARADDLYVFSVENAGPPIDAKQFRTFVRGFTSTRDGRRGIGLSIARHVATRWSGSVTLRAGTERTTIDLSIRIEPSPPITRP